MLKKEMEATRVRDYKALKIDSDAFAEGATIPQRYTCDGENVNPPLHIRSIPEEAVSLAVIVEDPDAPRGTFCHWVQWNIPVTHRIHEREHRGMKGMNDFGGHGYGGPCPPSGVHHYHFKVYALDATLPIPASTDKHQLEIAISDHVIGFGVLTGKYGRTNK